VTVEKKVNETFSGGIYYCTSHTALRATEVLRIGCKNLAAAEAGANVSSRFCQRQSVLMLSMVFWTERLGQAPPLQWSTVVYRP
jgi:hypothetical protein